MRSKALAASLLAAAFLGACKKPDAPAGTPAQPTATLSREAPAKPLGSKFAVLTTSMGVIKVKLFTEQAPRTCAHFIGLATGQKQWRDPRDGQVRFEPLYDGLTFHRVIPGFMIQTGDPLADGKGTIGYTIADEFHPALRFDRPGLLGMANTGPDTAGGQFFITVAPTPALDGQHAVFGEVVDGLAVAKAIAAVPREEAFGADKPLTPVVLESLEIVDKLK
jgi:peptidyl-prolyl cis-trans isomerase A (cyclophilin A)